MHQELADKIQQSQKFKDLVERRNRFAWTLAIIVLVVYYTFILVVAFSPQTLATPVSEGAVMSIGIPIGAGIIVMSWILTGVYTHKANSDFDEAVKQIKEEAK